MSWTGQCPACGEARLRENIAGLHYHSGPALRRWRKGVAASIGVTLLDDRTDAA